MFVLYVWQLPPSLSLCIGWFWRQLQYSAMSTECPHGIRVIKAPERASCRIQPWREQVTGDPASRFSPVLACLPATVLCSLPATGRTEAAPVLLSAYTGLSLVRWFGTYCSLDVQFLFTSKHFLFINNEKSVSLKMRLLSRVLDFNYKDSGLAQREWSLS